MDRLRFLSATQVRELAQTHGTPMYVYSRAELGKQAEKALSFKVPYGRTVRYAMKANSHPEILQIFHELGILIDASSGFEAEAAIAAGVPPQDIMLTSQELPKNLTELIGKGVKFTACSLHQLEEYGKIAPGTDVSVRLNPGIGSGENKKVTTSGIGASFGIWYEYLPEVLELAEKNKLRIVQLHTHIGVGTDPAEWASVAHANLDLVKKMPDVKSMSLGGGFKTGRMYNEPSADMQKISVPIYEMIEDFAKETGRELDIEIEPGTFLVANAGSLIAEVIDVKDTGPNGYEFLVLNAGMGEVTRPTMYGAQHPLIVIPKSEEKRETKEYVVAGHCCESSDVFTVAHGAATEIEPRMMSVAKIGDYMCMEGVGAYCASMSVKGYNSFPVAKELLVD